jgi:hypothetical protein
MLSLPWKLIGYGVGALALIGLLLTINGWRVERNRLRAWQTEVVSATRTAADNPKLGKKDVAAQIKLLGQAITDLKAGIAKQNAAIDAMGKESARQQADAAKAAQDARERARGAEATAERLRASAHSTQRLPGGVCEPSKAVQETWR